MSPLLRPAPSDRHVCEPPMYAVRPPLPPGAPPRGPAPVVPYPAPGEHWPVPALPPAVGCTWDCETCGTVWVVVEGRASRYRFGYAARGRAWAHASRRRAAQHRYRVTRGGTP